MIAIVAIALILLTIFVAVDMMTGEEMMWSVQCRICRGDFVNVDADQPYCDMCSDEIAARRRTSNAAEVTILDSEIRTGFTRARRASCQIPSNG